MSRGDGHDLSSPVPTGSQRVTTLVSRRGVPIRVELIGFVQTINGVAGADEIDVIGGSEGAAAVTLTPDEEKRVEALLIQEAIKSAGH